MTFSETVKRILSESSMPLTPQEVRDAIIEYFPEHYGTESHRNNMEKGHYKDLKHALLAQIYSLANSAAWVYCDQTAKPVKLSLTPRSSARSIPSIPISHSISKGQIKPYGNLADYSDKINDLLINSQTYHDAFYAADTFRGPSLYFHRRALESANGNSFSMFLEYIYAALTSWGMHRMGKGGSKMQSFDTFRLSVEKVRSLIEDARHFDVKTMGEYQWSCIKDIFFAINVMSSGTTLVGNSKVMHHLLPNIIPPIDREYTLWFLKGSTTIRNDINLEWQLMKEIISDFFIPVFNDAEFNRLAFEWLELQVSFPWDTSWVKIVDNLIIGAKRSRKG